MSQTPLPAISGADAYAYIHENIAEFGELLQDETTLLPTDETIIPAADAEQYLLDELDEDELEQLF